MIHCFDLIQTRILLEIYSWHFLLDIFPCGIFVPFGNGRSGTIIIGRSSATLVGAHQVHHRKSATRCAFMVVQGVLLFGTNITIFLEIKNVVLLAKFIVALT